MASLYNLARMSTSTTGTGTITLGSAVAPYLTFASAGVQDGETVSYAIYDPPNSECGRGVYTASGTTLTRSVLRSTNSNSAINLSGNAQVIISALAEDICMPVWAAGDVVADNDASFPSVAMRMSASWLVMYNPTTKSSKRIVPAEMTQNLACAINAQAAGFRDQASAYVDSQDVWWYWIWGPTVGLNTINSVTSPVLGGPTLPSGYTHFCPGFLTKIWVQGGTPTINPALLGGPTKLRVRDNMVSYTQPAYIEPISGLQSYPTAYFDITGVVPFKAKLTNLELNPEMHASAGAQVIGGAVWVSGALYSDNFFNHSLYPMPSSWTPGDAAILWALNNRQVACYFMVTSGTPDNTLCDIFVLGYTF